MPGDLLTVTAAATSVFPAAPPDSSGHQRRGRGLADPRLSVFSGRRQTVSAGPVTAAGLPNFLPATAARSPCRPSTCLPSIRWSPRRRPAGRRRRALRWTRSALRPALSAGRASHANRPAATPNFLYVSVAGGILTTGSTLLPPVYQFGGTPSVTAGQFTFNIAEMRGYLGNGTSAPQVNLVMVGDGCDKCCRCTVERRLCVQRNI